MIKKNRDGTSMTHRPRYNIIKPYVCTFVLIDAAIPGPETDRGSWYEHRSIGISGK